MKYAQGDKLMLMFLQHEHQSKQICGPGRECPREEKVRPEGLELATFKSGVRRAAVAP
jgi:hypothetical protein